ncbi:aminotransferase class I/II-fold pyridoxal phosphate-dependent enzyme [Allobacillus sp. GCM10007491]|uniref:Aminotransferase class I/II-fold pyridoxal phosphate-dependent enzyme n=1 Tax=Allobacillus saliphilus TaxID=2912308 RepID=A0A941HSZ5_9BACI|nr:aminotransferase class I/II-fold pyridoxal phosphate-dependent enzyme [Allobacillus saliphilus]MBR7554276.1 aminotransferase class I/II-fold pyridoxal phosphate-dependent enzyme [Allobacillus saliphilus]
MNQYQTPLFDKLIEHTNENPVSFHVPGHKNGRVFPSQKINPFQEMMTFDLTELSNLDDLHQPEGVIQEAEELAAEYFQVERTFFLVNGTTSGNLAMILATCSPGDEILVQRNSHKSIMHALELAGAQPIFVSPDYDEQVDRVSIISRETIREAINRYPSIKAVVLTYPDYFGSTYDLEKIIELCHENNLPVMVDEAHGAHLRLGTPFPKSAIDCGADVVVHSAHKTLPALTMGSYLHVCSSKRISTKRIAHYLQMVQTSSPSYVVMASLDLARYFLATCTKKDLEATFTQIQKIRELLSSLQNVSMQPIRPGIDDPLKTTLHSNDIDMREIDAQLQANGIYAEMVQNNQLLLIHGFYDEQFDFSRLQQAIKSVNTLKLNDFHGKITSRHAEKDIQRLELSYQELHHLETEWVPWSKAVERLAAETITPYPPGIPLILRGERIREKDLEVLHSKEQLFQSIQYDGYDLTRGMTVYREQI